MKICAACNQALSNDKFSKKQWQLKQRRRCKKCIADKREVNLDAARNGTQLPDNREAKLSEALPKEGPTTDSECVPSLTDEDLFKQPAPRDECPICMLPLRSREKGYRVCCGKVICHGCSYAIRTTDNNRALCPFCRSPDITTDEFIERIKKRVKGDDAVAICHLGGKYYRGRDGLPHDYEKGIKLFLRAGELGNAMAYYNVATAYVYGEGVERDKTKAKHYYGLAAMGGYERARHNLGIMEAQDGNAVRAVKHWMIAAGAGHDESLKKIREFFSDGHATKDDFEKALRANKESKDEMKSEQREEAARFYG